MSWWIDRQKKDFFIKKRKDDGVLSRSYFKIEEIDGNFDLCKKNYSVLDLGASPGGWSEYFCSLEMNVTAVDILPINNKLKIKFIQIDFFELNLDEEFDLIVSDISPNISGNKIIDSNKVYNINLHVLNLCKYLKKNKAVAIKTFSYVDMGQLKKLYEEVFKYVKFFKPKSSRPESAEIYLIGIKKLYS